MFLLLHATIPCLCLNLVSMISALPSLHSTTFYIYSCIYISLECYYYQYVYIRCRYVIWLKNERYSLSYNAMKVYT